MNWYKVVKIAEIQKRIIKMSEIESSIISSVELISDGKLNHVKTFSFPSENYKRIYIFFISNYSKHISDEYKIKVDVYMKYPYEFTGLDPMTGLDVNTSKKYVLNIKGIISKEKEGVNEDVGLMGLGNNLTWSFSNMHTPYETAIKIKRIIDNPDGPDDSGGPGNSNGPNNSDPTNYKYIDDKTEYEEDEYKRYKNVPETYENMAWLPGRGPKR